MRLVGTCKTYSKKAMPQLNNITKINGLLLKFFKWPYQANVMKRLEKNKKIMVRNTDGYDSLKIFF